MNSLYSFDEILNIVNDEIKKISYPHPPQSLFEPISYILSLGGKRVRPALALIGCNLYQDDVRPAMPVALAIEVFHNFTLLHDDLMDKADVRRGQPTVHIKWNDNTAVLSGDAMLIEAYREIAKVDPKYLPKALELFTQTATEICCGQQLDMEFEKRMDVSIEEYIEMIRLKTAVLLGGALKEGAMIGGASEKDMDLLYEYGINVGLAFQLKDDLLDVYGNPETFGKRIGGDILCNKKTYLLINALSDPTARPELECWIAKTDFDEEEKIKAVTAIYDRLKLKEKSERLIQQYYEASVKNLDAISADPKRKQVLYDLTEDLTKRIS